MACAGFLGFKLCDFQRQSGLEHRGVLRVAITRPGFGIGRHDGGQHRGLLQALGLNVAAADQLIERDALVAQIVVGADFLRGGQIEAGLRFTGVGDGGGADFEIAFGRGQLFADGSLARARGGQGVLSGQHIEIGLGQTHDQVLLGGLKLVGRGFELQLCLIDAGAAGAVEQRLRG